MLPRERAEGMAEIDVWPCKYRWRCWAKTEVAAEREGPHLPTRNVVDVTCRLISPSIKGQERNFMHPDAYSTYPKRSEKEEKNDPGESRYRKQGKRRAHDGREKKGNKALDMSKEGVEAEKITEPAE